MQEHLGRHVNYLDENFLEVLQQYIASSKDERITGEAQHEIPQERGAVTRGLCA